MSREEVEKLCEEEAYTFDIGLYFEELITPDQTAVNNHYSTAMVTNLCKNDKHEIDINDEEIVFHRGTAEEVSYNLETLDEDTLVEELDSIFELFDLVNDTFNYDSEDEENYNDDDDNEF